MPHTKEQAKAFRRTKVGLIKSIFYDQVNHSRNRNHPLPEYTKEELVEWVLNNPEFNELYKNWVDSKYKKDLRPSLDRLDDYVHYKLDNLQLVTFRDNYKRSHLDMKQGINNKRNKKVYQYTKDEKFIKEYHSTRFASRQLNIDQSSIVKCCNGKYKSAGGYVWSYKLKNLNNESNSRKLSKSSQ